MANSRAAPKRARTKEIGVGGELHQTAAMPGARQTTNFGVPISDDQNSLKAGVRGPALLEDFVLREKIQHFDHERIPERIVHARGSAAHGYFELTKSLARYTRAQVLTEVGKRTEVFTRFSTVAGGAGSVDTPRDVRGFAVKLYTVEGNWDLVGNNIPVFFIQDAIKFPDLIHAVKMEADRGYPQAASAHDTFWDFIGLMPESTHMIMWAMSDRAIPRSLRMMEGFGVNTFRLVNDKDEATFVKFHWRPVLGTQSTCWDEAVKIAGADPDYHRRDLHDAIESGAFPEWQFGVQLLSQAEADALAFDILDATKLIPEEAHPIQVVGRMVLNRNPDNFFAQTEQAAFLTSPKTRCSRAGCFPTRTPSCRGWGRSTSTRSRSIRPRAARSRTCSATATCRCRRPGAGPTTSRTAWQKRARTGGRGRTPRAASAARRSPRRGPRRGFAPKASPTTTRKPGSSIGRRRRSSRRTWRARSSSNSPSAASSMCGRAFSRTC
jgi:hypothetical protein